MSIRKIRAKAGRSFARLDMDIVRSAELTNAEIGLMLRLLNLPDAWEYSDAGYHHVYPADGQTTLRTQLKSLEAKGFIQRIHHQRDDRGLFLKTTLIIHEIIDKQ